MWTIGFADRLRFPRFPSELGKRGNARLRPHTHRGTVFGEMAGYRKDVAVRKKWLITQCAYGRGTINHSEILRFVNEKIECGVQNSMIGFLCE
jgi:hypothetical protein